MLCWLFLGLVLLPAGFSWLYINYAIPDHLNLVVSEEEIFNFALPPGVTFESEYEEVVLGNQSNIPAGQVKIQAAEPISMYGTTEGSYRIGMKLFGIIDMKDIQVDVVTDTYAIPCGTPIGIYLKSNGVMVIGTGEIVNEAGNVVEPAFGILKSGDYIETVNGQTLEDKDDLIAAVNACGGNAVHMEVRRDGELIDVDLNPVQAEDGSYKLGAWVRDDTQGIGTVTYVDMNGSFGALGHGISDSDTGRLVDTKEGELYATEILGIEKGEPGNPGVMSGVIYYGPGTKMGEVTANTDEGIFGTVNARFKEDIASEAIPVGFRQDVKKGNAVIRSSVSGEVKDYDIEIQKVDHAALQKNKGMTIKVVDEELLELTGGIVQGMSGSPIIQDGKLIGAVTHVLVNEPARGYGIFIENMIEVAE
ncbi:MAG: SpoIVB peptidase [Lachnospiraceae bacterium]|nr:SpoIVB peptidase [Lachnospiraceae bacterium]